MRFPLLLACAAFAAAPVPRDLVGTFELAGGNSQTIHLRLYLPESGQKVCGLYHLGDPKTPVLLLGDRVHADPSALMLSEYTGGSIITGRFELKDEGASGTWTSADGKKQAILKLVSNTGVFPLDTAEVNLAGAWETKGLRMEVALEGKALLGRLHLPGGLTQENPPGSLEYRGERSGNVAVISWNNAQGSASEAMLLFGDKYALWFLTLDTSAEEGAWPSGTILTRAAP